MGIKLGVGIILLTLACIITLATCGATLEAATIMLTMALSMIAGIGVSALMAMSYAVFAEEEVSDGVLHAMADAVFIGGLFAFVSAGVNAAKTGIRGISIGNKPCSTVWPHNNGFEGKPTKVRLKKGVVIDRYGKSSGKFAAPAGTPFEMRSLPSSYISKELHTYKVLKDVPVLQGVTAPWFCQPGGGVQYMFNKPISYLISKGIIMEVL